VKQNNLISLETALELLPPEMTSELNTGGLFNSDPQTIWMPPKDYWPDPFLKIETPIDDRGLVDIDKLITDVKGTIDPNFKWEGTYGTHHFYWPSVNYSYDTKWAQEDRRFSQGSFRNLPIHKGELPKVFENWLHFITCPPEVPSRGVMQYRMEAWQVATDLFHSASQVVMWQRREKRRSDFLTLGSNLLFLRANDDSYAQEYIAEILSKHFRGLDRHIDALHRVPPEYRLVEPTESPYDIASTLGRFVARSSMKLRRLFNNQPDDALPA
jgi:hypothetical protein